MRKQHLAMWISMLLITVVAAAAQTPSQLERVNVVRGTDDIRVEMSASSAITPKLSSLDSPARVVVDLPSTVMANGQSHINVGAAGVKGVRIGMSGQTTRVVIDLDKTCAYELTPGPAGKLVLTLHANGTQTAAVSAPASTATITPVKAVTTTSAVPANHPMSPFSPKVVDSRSLPPSATKP